MNDFTHRLVFACALGVAAFIITGPAAARFDSARVAVEAPAVAARFPDPAVTYDTPGFRVGRDDFTSHAELMAFVAELQARSGGFTLRIIGASKEARAIPLLVFADGRGAIDDPEGVLRITVETEPVDASLPAGTYYISLAQPLANLVAAALEPDSQNSLAASRLLPLTEGRTVLRAIAPPSASLQVWEDR